MTLQNASKQRFGNVSKEKMESIELAVQKQNYLEVNYSEENSFNINVYTNCKRLCRSNYQNHIY